MLKKFFLVLLFIAAILFFVRLLRKKTDLFHNEEPLSITDIELSSIPASGVTSNFPAITVIPDLPTPVVLPPLPAPFVSSHCEENYAVMAGTANFKLAEFNSNDGTEVPFELRGNVQELMEQLEIIRQEAGNRPVTITSGYRSPSWNEAIGGASKSMHLCGKAADIKISGMSANKVHQLIKRLINEGKIIGGGLGRYNTFTHYDTGKRRDWG